MQDISLTPHHDKKQFENVCSSEEPIRKWEENNSIDKTCLPSILKILLIALVAPEQMSFGFRRSLIFFASEKSRFARQNIFSWDSREGDLSQFYSLLI